MHPARNIGGRGGRYTAENTKKKEAELLALMRAAQLRPLGRVSFAGYDPPSTLPFRRRVDTWVEIE